MLSNSQLKELYMWAANLLNGCSKDLKKPAQTALNFINSDFQKSSVTSQAANRVLNAVNHPYSENWEGQPQK